MDTPKDMRKLPDYNKKKTSKAEEVYNYLIDGIVSGVWLAGDRINDKELSDHLGVNRLSVREAISRLIQDDVITQEQWKGFYVRTVTPEDVKHLVDVRIVLEKLAINLFMEQDVSLNEIYFKEMEDAIEKAAVTLSEGDHAMYMKIDFHFHELIYKASRNPIIENIIGYIRTLTGIMRNISMGKDPEQFKKAALKSMEDHRNMLAAFKKGDIQGAQMLMAEHLGKTFVSNIVEQLDPEEETK
jgi:DNA-binding GntR family transcriptional regulator